MFNANPSIQCVQLTPAQRCLVIDDALQEPAHWVEQAALHRQYFRHGPRNAYPGIELLMPDEFSVVLADFFNLHIRRWLDARRLLSYYSRFSMVTAPAVELMPSQWLCHRDRFELGAGHCMVASVLYLFHDEALGGTNFFRPCLAPESLGQLIVDSGHLTAADFQQRYAVTPGYQTESSPYFEKIATVPAQWNRMIFYDGGEVFHGGDIRQPERLTDDPRTGRLTLNGFFQCRRSAV